MPLPPKELVGVSVPFIAEICSFVIDLRVCFWVLVDRFLALGCGTVLIVVVL